jgi:hypothetical protein
LEAARCAYAADLETAMAVSAEEKRRLESDIRDLKERLGIFDHTEHLDDDGMPTSTGVLQLSRAEIRLESELRELKEHYGIDDGVDGGVSTSSPSSKRNGRGFTTHHGSGSGSTSESSDGEDEACRGAGTEEGEEDYEGERKAEERRLKTAKRRSKSPGKQARTEDSPSNSSNESSAASTVSTVTDGSKQSVPEEQQQPKKPTAKTPAEMCKIFGITNTLAFDGGTFISNSRKYL